MLLWKLFHIYPCIYFIRREIQLNPLTINMFQLFFTCRNDTLGVEEAASPIIAFKCKWVLILMSLIEEINLIL